MPHFCFVHRGYCLDLLLSLPPTFRCFQPFVTLPPRRSARLNTRMSQNASASTTGPGDNHMMANLATLMNASKASPNKLTGSNNYRMWAKDMELILVRMGCWEVTINKPPAPAARTSEWINNNNWARSEIHLWCSPKQQDHIIDSDLGCDS